jgi:hypothetical protein
MKNDFTKLENALRGLNKNVLSSESKDRMRCDMLLRMNDSVPAELKYPSLERVKDYIKKVAFITQPSAVFKASVKENVLAFVEKKHLGSNFIWSITKSWQKVLATFMVGVISLSSFTVYFADIPVAKAEKMTAFQDIYGDVDVVRDGQTIVASKYMQLLEGDTVVTGENGLAVIRYFDDSVSRLSSFTELKMQCLYQDKKNKAKTKVEIELMNGRVWNQVINLVDEQASFEISVNNVTARTSEKASFDISNKEGDKKVSVAVFENKVEVSVPEKRKENKQVVVEGYSVEVVENESIENNIVLNNKEDELWVQVNKAEDKQYKKVVDKEKEEESKKEAGVLPADALYSAKKINESTKLLVTTDKTEKNKIKVDIAIKRLAEASALLSNGDKEGAMAPLDDFAKIVDEISLEVEGSEDLRAYVKSAFAEKEKDLSTVLPDGNRYMAKEALRDARLELAVTDEEKNDVSLKSATQKVVEAKELFEDEKQEPAQITLLEAAQEIVTVSADENAIVDQNALDQKEQTLSTVRVLKGAVEDKEDINVEVQMIIGVTEEALEKPVEVIPEMDSAVVITIEEEPKVQLQAGQE